MVQQPYQPSNCKVFSSCAGQPWAVNRNFVLFLISLTESDTHVSRNSSEVRCVGAKRSYLPQTLYYFIRSETFFFKKNIILVSGEASNRNDFPKLTKLHFKNIPTDTHVRRNSSRTTLSEAEKKFIRTPKLFSSARKQQFFSPATFC